ncbi:probable L-type lectin-domain containing receptor kinase VII.2 [Humulus lupulus]|uniref:probable L-type lectin-domain containing receptor kinase VII.2 n=1 Tax=Humulus lupulus TaxID=3486 RepID=UPI002B4005CB|nr:probable L-type lectin-domain containing receptor kinase VII.2 [Humulus lupulus]
MSLKVFAMFFPAIIIIILSLNWVSSTTEFIFNSNFNSSNILLFGDSTIESSILSLTNASTFSLGRSLYPSKIATKPSNSSTLVEPFSTSFIFSIASVDGFQPGHGFAFVLVPSRGTEGGSSSQHLGLFNFSNNGDSVNHILGIEFDVFKNQEFQDIDDNHVGLNVNSLNSMASHSAGYWDGEDVEEFRETELKNGVNYQVWIDFSDSRINITMAPAGRRRPQRPLISESVNLSGVLFDEMYVGFSGATGQLVESHRILAWSFSNTNFSIGDALVTQNLPSFVVPKGSVLKSKGFIVGVSIGGGLLAIVLLVIGYVVLVRKTGSVEENTEEWETEYWPHRISYKEIHQATEGFLEKNVIGTGGNGKVYKGVLPGGVDIAVKRISLKNDQGMREFLAEISSLGRLKHRNLVGLRGWCRREKGSLILVYDYMQNGSLDSRVFDCDESMALTWEERLKVLKDVASGIFYLHEGWEVKVLHRDIKASNVLLDKDMTARLGDFGLAKMHHHDKLASTTIVVGTVGYMAPEVVQTGRVSTQTDVFGFGVLVLEVVCGRRPIQEGLPGLVHWVWRIMEETGEVVSALDARIKSKGGYNMEEVERVLSLGLWCVHPEPHERPTMRQVVKLLERSVGGDGETEEEGMEMNKLLEKMKEAAASSSHTRRNNFGGRGLHPTFDEIKNCVSSSMSLSGTSVIQVGR